MSSCSSDQHCDNTILDSFLMSELLVQACLICQMSNLNIYHLSFYLINMIFMYYPDEYQDIIEPQVR